MITNINPKLNTIASIICISISLLGNHWIIGYLLAGGEIDSIIWQSLLWSIQGVFLFLSIYIYLKKNIIPIQYYFFSITTIVLLFLISVILDLALAVFGFPSDRPPQYTHPPNYTETRKSIDEYEYEFTTNSQGLRYKEIPLTKQNDIETRILVIGSSFVEGQGVLINETFSAILETKFSSKTGHRTPK